MQFFFEPGSVGASRVGDILRQMSDKLSPAWPGAPEVRMSVSGDPALLVRSFQSAFSHQTPGQPSLIGQNGQA